MAVVRAPASDLLRETPFWRTRQFVVSVACLLVPAIIAFVFWLEKENRRYQAERRLMEHPQLGALAAKLKTTVETNTKSRVTPGKKAAVALWLGQVDEYRETQSAGGTGPASLLYLTDAALLAGARSKNDSSERLAISGRDFTWGGPLPRKGDTWMVAVWRDEEGRNVIHTAARVPVK